MANYRESLFRRGRRLLFSYAQRSQRESSSRKKKKNSKETPKYPPTTVVRYKCEGNFVKGRGVGDGGWGGDTKARRHDSVVRLARIKEKFSTRGNCVHARMHGRLIQWCTFRGPVAHSTTETTLIQPPQRAAAYGIAVQTCKYFVANHRPLLCRVTNILHCYRTAFLCKLADICALFVHQHQKTYLLGTQ